MYEQSEKFQGESLLTRLSSAKMQREMILMRFNSVDDRTFLELIEDREVANFARAASHVIVLREENIRYFISEGKSLVTTKDLYCKMKFGKLHDLIEFLHCLDDCGFYKVSEHPSVKSVIDSNTTLSHRYSIISSDDYEPLEANPKQRTTIKPISFTL